MEIFMVGSFKKGKNTTGFRLLSVDNNGKTEVKDVAYTLLLDTIKAGLVKVQNLKIEDNKLKGINGTIDRYGTVGKTQALVIIRELHDEKDNFTGYFCSDANGNTRSLSEKDAIAFADKIGIANGKVVNSPSGDKRISSIEGSYSVLRVKSDNKPTEVKQPEQKQPEQKQNESTTTPTNEVNHYLEAMRLIASMENRKEFKNSFAQKVSYSIIKYKKCSDKQFKIIKDLYDSLPAETPASAPASAPAPKVETPAPVPKVENTAPKVETPKVEIPAPAEKPKAELNRNYHAIYNKQNIDMDDILVYVIMKDGNAYVKGIQKDKDDIETIVIPETTVLNGKTVKITGIMVGAFAGKDIKEVKTSKNIVDIGQEAFLNCKNLEYVDFSESMHRHISMHMFKDCKNLLQIRVGNYVQRIHEGAFMNCKKLTSIELPSDTDTIARNAFYGCKSLQICKHSAKFINDSAFKDCVKLESINFDTVNQIGTYAFRNTGFTELVIPGNVDTIGRKAFADCLRLETITLEEGVRELGEYCFSKPVEKTVRRDFGYNVEYSPTKLVNTPKSIISVLSDAFRHCELVRVWTGSVCESHCIGFNIPYERIDRTTLDNSTRTRVKSEAVGSNPIEVLYRVLSEDSDNASNPELELNVSKLCNVPFSDSQLSFFGIERTTEQVEPRIKFKAIVNYLQDISSLFQAPLSNSVLRLQDTFYVNSVELFNDGCNRIYKVAYTIMDTLEAGSYIMIIMDNTLRYMCECNMLTNIDIVNDWYEHDSIPVSKFLHAGDTLGEQATISGSSGVITDSESFKRINVGSMLLSRLKKHGISFQTTKKDSILYLPVCNLALNLHDGRIWDRPGVISRTTKNCINLVQILDYNEMKEHLKKNNKTTYNEAKLFYDLSKLSNGEVQRRVRNIAVIEDEKEAQLYLVSKQFTNVINNAKLNEIDVTPNLITPEIFMELSRSYWMVHKDEAWLRSAGTKSLNKTNEYTIGKYKLIEYKSNQVVKFSNPYMNGKKGAYIFTLMHNRDMVGVYASRYSMLDISKKLYNLTYIKESSDITEIPTLFTSAENFDKVHPYLFYNFYDVLQSKNGWSFDSAYANYNYGVSFHIAMYKPTGIFYLTMERCAITEIKKEGNTEKVTQALRVIPILPIGNMDRALMVATTTNVNAKDSALLKELLGVMTTFELQEQRFRLSYNQNRDNLILYKDNYTKARRLVIDRVKDVKEYKKLIDDRAIYMLGTLHAGELQREYSDEDIESNIDDLEIDLSDINIPDEDDVDDFEDIDLDLDDTEIDIDDEGDDESISFEEFFETAKSMGVTDESQARVLYLNFLNQQ